MAVGGGGGPGGFKMEWPIQGTEPAHLLVLHTIKPAIKLVLTTVVQISLLLVPIVMVTHAQCVCEKCQQL